MTLLCAKDSPLSREIADPNNWTWEDQFQDNSQWEPSPEGWTDFRTKWYGKEDDQPVDETGDSNRYLSLEPLPHKFLPSSMMFIPHCFLDMFDRIWEKAMETPGKEGVILVGQRGTGRTLFTLYALVRLLQRRQIVLYANKAESLYLFYHDGVYRYKTRTYYLYNHTKPSLPQPKPSSGVFIWSLSDIIEQPGSGTTFLRRFPCFPVATSLPDNEALIANENVWMSQGYPVITGLPIFTRDELAQGLKCQPQYKPLLDSIRDAHSSGDKEKLLSVIPGARERLQEIYGDNPHLPTPEDVIDRFLSIAIDRFGYIPRDVFGGVLNYPWWFQFGNARFRMSFSHLQRAVFDICTRQRVNHLAYECLLTLSPIYSESTRLVSASWKVDFTSDCITRKVMQAIGHADGRVLYPQIEPFYDYPGTRDLARRFLGPPVHRRITQTRAKSDWPLSHLTSDTEDPPHYIVQRNAPISETTRFPKIKRKTVSLGCLADLASRLQNKAYYVLEDPMFPFFDAFTVELDHAAKSAILWVIQITTSRRDRGSTLGYTKIREIIAMVKDEIGGGEPPVKKSKSNKPANRDGHNGPSVEVRYVLVVPRLLEDDSNPDSDLKTMERHFPNGWTQDREKHDHCGNVYSLALPLGKIKLSSKAQKNTNSAF